MRTGAGTGRRFGSRLPQRLNFGICLGGAMLVTLLACPAGAGDPSDAVVVPATERALQSTLRGSHRRLPDCVEGSDRRAARADGCDDWLRWKRKQEAQRPRPGNRHSGRPAEPPDVPSLPAPPDASQSWLDRARSATFAAAERLLGWIVDGQANAATVGPITGALTTWTADDLLAPPDQPPGLGVQVFGKYDSASQIYYLALKAPDGEVIGFRTTLWLDTDRDRATGYLGADYGIQVYSDLKPYLYEGTSLDYLGAIDSYALSTDRRLLELAVPAAALGLTSAQSIDLFGNIADDPIDSTSPSTSEWLYFPTVWDSGRYELPGTPTVYPERTDPSKRVGMVFCEASQARFWASDAGNQTDTQRKAYSQLYMALQHQVMMAGIPFDLLPVSALRDVASIVDYDALVLPYCANVATDDLDAIARTLYQGVYHYHIGLITADDLLTNDASGAAFSGDAYARMAQLTGLTREGGGGPATSVEVFAANASHPAVRGYSNGETILEMPGFYWSHYEPLDGQTAIPLANQAIDVTTTLPAVWATETGGRNVHFSSVELMGNTNLAWQALQWVLYGDAMPVGLKMGRGSALFAARADMDQSMIRAAEGDAEPADGVVNVDEPLLDLIQQWKTAYNFVGSYYINVGDAPEEGEWTDWDYSGPLFADYVALGSEIGTHSLTHPDDTNLYDAVEHPGGYSPAMGGLSWEDWLSREFGDSMGTILGNVSQYSPTRTNWEERLSRGGAVPGMPESLEAAATILRQGDLDYLTGGYSGVGAGFPGAIGYLIPPGAELSAPLPSEAATRVYFSPTLYFDFTLIEWGLPTGQLSTVPESDTGSALTQTPIPATCSASYPVCAESVWPDQYLETLDHSSQPVVVWPWHDYGPTISSACTTQTLPGTHCYSLDMYENLLSAARNTGAELVTLMDAADRIASLKDASLVVEDADGDQVSVTATPPVGGSLGKFALQVWPTGRQIVSSVDDWYAYGDDKVYLPADGGSFTARLGTSRAAVTHISRLPMRAELRSLSGDGSSLSFALSGEGVVEVLTQRDAASYGISVDGVTATPRACADAAPNCVALSFDGFGVHTGTVTMATPAASLSVTGLSFGALAVGTTSVPQPVVVTSSGVGQLRISGVSVDGAFSATHDCADPLAPGSSCTIEVSFEPTTAGVQPGRLLVQTNAAATPVLEVSLAGEGTAAPIASVSPSGLAFSDQAVGTTSGAQTLTLSNAGSAALELTAIEVTGDFAQANACPSVLDVGASCSIDVTFAPTETGNRSGRIELATNDPERALLTVTLEGAGVGAPAAPGSPTVSCSRYLLLFDVCQVRWEDRSSDEQGFRVQYAKDSDYTRSLRTVTEGANATSTTVYGLSWWTRYWFRARSYNAFGASAYVTASPSPVRTP